MARLIDADALKRKIEESGVDGTIANYVKKTLAATLDNEPTVDAAPVVHGRWIKVEAVVWKCSACGEEDCFAYTWREGKRQEDLFCPYCGAKMDGGEA